MYDKLVTRYPGKLVSNKDKFEKLGWFCVQSMCMNMQKDNNNYLKKYNVPVQVLHKRAPSTVQHHISCSIHS